MRDEKFPEVHFDDEHSADVEACNPQSGDEGSHLLKVGSTPEKGGI